MPKPEASLRQVSVQDLPSSATTSVIHCSLHFDFTTFKVSPLLISHWFTDDRVVSKLELNLSAVFPDANMIVSSANKAVCKGDILAVGRSLVYIENRRGPRTVSCGTLEPIQRCGETVPLTITACTVGKGKHLIHWHI